MTLDSGKSIELYLFQIEDSILKVEEYLTGTSIEDYQRDVKTQDAVNMRLQVIGEAVSKLPDEIRQKFPDSLNHNTIYGIVRRNLQELFFIIPQLKEMQD